MVSFSHRGIWINIISTLSSFCMKNWDCNLPIQTSFVFSVYVEGLNLRKCCTCTKSGSVLRRTWPNLILEQTVLTYRKSYTHIHENFSSVTQKQLCTMLWNIAQILFAKMFIVIYTCLYSLKISYWHTTYLGHLSPLCPQDPHHTSLTSCIFLNFYLFTLCVKQHCPCVYSGRSTTGELGIDQ